MAYSDAESLGIKGCSDLMFRAQKTMLRMKSLSDTLNGLASAIQAESEAARTNFEAVSNMYGLVSLPAELFARIFECIVNEDASLANPSRWKSAVTLSHVCQYFRNIALSCPQIWANVSRSSEMVASCLSRSKEVPLDVELRVAFGANTQELRFEKLLQEALPHSNRWRSLGIHFVSSSVDDDALSWVLIDDSAARLAFREIDAPLLESLDIRNDEPANVLYKSYVELANWITPNLRTVTTVRYFPFLFAGGGLENVTTLDITLILNQLNFTDLLNDLSWMNILENFTLKLERCSNLFPIAESDDLQSYEVLELPSVRHLRIETEYVDDYSRASSIQKLFLFSSLRFPGIVNLHVKVSGTLDEKDDEQDGVASLHLEGEIMRILWNFEQFPRVECFHLEVCAICNEDPYTYGFFESQYGVVALIIPIELLPSVKHFTLYSNKKLEIEDRDSGFWFDDADFGDRDITHPAVMAPTLPALQTITIKTPKGRTRCSVGWVKGVLEKQKEQGQWEEFRQLVVVDNDEFADDQPATKATRIYVGDAALAWCERLIDAVCYIIFFRLQ